MSLFYYCISVLVTIFILKIWSIESFKNSVCADKITSKRKLSINKNCVLIVLAFFPLWILLAFRDKTVGVDTGGTYYYIYRNILYGEYARSVRVQVEQGYLLLNRLILHYNQSYFAVIFVTGTVSWFLFYRYIIKKSLDPSLSILIFFLNFFYFHQFNVIRQLLSCAIALQGFQFIYERKFLKYLLVILLAASIHKMVLLLVPIYFIYNIKISAKKIAVITIGAKLFFSLIWRLIVPLLEGTRYSNVIQWEGAYAGGYAIGELITTSFLLWVGYYFYLCDGKKNLVLNFNLWLQLFALVIEVNSNMIPIVYRFLWFANINTFLYIPEMINTIQSKTNKKIVKAMTILIFVLYFTQKWLNGDDMIQEFQFWQG